MKKVIFVYIAMGNRLYRSGDKIAPGEAMKTRTPKEKMQVLEERYKGRQKRSGLKSFNLYEVDFYGLLLICDSHTLDQRQFQHAGILVLSTDNCGRKKEILWHSGRKNGPNRF